MDIAIARETASGRPSGIETIKMTTPMIAILPHLNRVSLEKRSSSSLKMMMKKRKMNYATMHIIKAMKEYSLIPFAAFSKIISK